MTKQITHLYGIPVITNDKLPVGVMFSTFTISSIEKACALNEPHFTVADHEAQKLVSWYGHPDHNAVKRWFEKRGLIVRKDHSTKNLHGYFVHTDTDTALLAKLTWGGR